MMREAAYFTLIRATRGGPGVGGRNSCIVSEVRSRLYISWPFPNQGRLTVYAPRGVGKFLAHARATLPELIFIHLIRISPSDEKFPY